MGTSSSMCEGASDRCKVHRGLHVGTPSMFLDLGLMYFFFCSSGIFLTFASHSHARR